MILKSEFGGFPYAGQGTIVDGKHGEWYGVIFQDRGGCGRILTIEPCSWIDGWPMLGTNGDGIIPETVSLDGDCTCHKEPQLAVIEKDYQINHNYIKEDITTETGSISKPGNSVTLRTSVMANSIYDARNTFTWRTWGPTCADTVTIDASKMNDGDFAGLAALNGDSGVLSIKKEGKKTFLIFSEEKVSLSNDKKEITNVDKKEIERVEIPKKNLSSISLVMTGDFNPKRDIANFFYSFDGNQFKQIGGDYKMIFDYRRLFMGSRYALFYYPTKKVGGVINVKL